MTSNQISELIKFILNSINVASSLSLAPTGNYVREFVCTSMNLITLAL